MSVYLDWNATTPPLAEVLDAMREAAANAWGNPASVHADGRAAPKRTTSRFARRSPSPVRAHRGAY